MVKITIISIDDWECMYSPDGRCLKQGHSIEVRDFFEALQKIDAHPKDIELCRMYSTSNAVNEYANNHGTLPDTLDEYFDLEKTG